jgi:hypothetical protein
MVAPSTSRSAVATARFFQRLKPVLAVNTVDTCRWRAETIRKR